MVVIVVEVWEEKKQYIEGGEKERQECLLLGGVIVI